MREGGAVRFASRAFSSRNGGGWRMLLSYPGGEREAEGGVMGDSSIRELVGEENGWKVGRCISTGVS